MRPLSQIAQDIRKDWKNVYFGAAPWLDALATLNTMNDNYYADDAVTVVSYFLANATTWRGETARNIKKELNQMLKSKS